MSSSAQDAIVMIDDEDKIFFWNPAAEKMFGHSSNEALGQNAHFLIAPDKYRESFKKGFSLFQSSKQGPVIGKIIEMEAVRKNGNIIPVELSVSTMIIKEE